MRRFRCCWISSVINTSWLRRPPMWELLCVWFDWIDAEWLFRKTEAKCDQMKSVNCRTRQSVGCVSRRVGLLIHEKPARYLQTVWLAERSALSAHCDCIATESSLNWREFRTRSISLNESWTFETLAAFRWIVWCSNRIIGNRSPRSSPFWLIVCLHHIESTERTHHFHTRSHRSVQSKSECGEWRHSARSLYCSQSDWDCAAAETRAVGDREARWIAEFRSLLFRRRRKNTQNRTKWV